MSTLYPAWMMCSIGSLVLARLKWQMCLVYLDDVLVFGKSFWNTKVKNMQPGCGLTESAKAELVNRLVSAPVLAHFDENIDVCFQTDASLIGLGVVLMQDSGIGPRPVAYVSRRLTETESKDHANELECLAIVWALKKLRHYVYGRRFSICTDSSPVRWLW